MRVAIIGAGNVGGTLGTAWAQKAGHEIFFGVRNPTSDQTQAVVRRLDGRGRAGTPEQAAAFAQFIVLTTPWNAAEAAIRSMGDLNGKIILDATNPLAMGPDGLALAIGHSTSAGEKVQGWAKDASVFKALNTTGFGNMADPIFHGAILDCARQLDVGQIALVRVSHRGVRDSGSGRRVWAGGALKPADRCRSP